ncbi:MAG: hypothetical protein ACT4QC_13535 [Planctomycetaceae bacterium]
MRTMYRAKSRLNVASFRNGFGKSGKWYWSLDARPGAGAKRRRARKIAQPLAIFDGAADGTPELSAGCVLTS